MNKKKLLSAAKCPKWFLPYRMFFQKCKQGIPAARKGLLHRKGAKRAPAEAGNADIELSMGPTGLMGTSGEYWILAPDGVINFSRLEAGQKSNRIVWEYLGPGPSADCAGTASPKRYMCPQLSSTHPASSGKRDIQRKYNCLRYNHVDAGVDLRYEFLPYGLQKTIIIKKDQPFPTHAFRLKTHALSPAYDPSGHSLHFLNADEKVVFHLSAPFLLDQAGSQSSAVRYKLSPIGPDAFLLCLEPDADWVHAPDRVFPVSIHFTLYYADRTPSF